MDTTASGQFAMSFLSLTTGTGDDGHRRATNPREGTRYTDQLAETTALSQESEGKRRGLGGRSVSNRVDRSAS